MFRHIYVCMGILRHAQIVKPRLKDVKHIKKGKRWQIEKKTVG
jgi:hypothetical protein